MKLRELCYSCVYGVGESIELMNINHFTMKKIIKTISSLMVICALLVSAVVTPMSALASTESASSPFPAFNFPGFDFPDFGFPGIDFPDFNLPPTAVTSCEVTANTQEVAFGGSVTLEWDTTGFSTVMINGQTVSGDTGTVVMSNIQVNTTYTLTASSADGSSNCTASVTITCLPLPPVILPAPICDSFTASPSTITNGGTSQLAWQTSNATRVVINNGIGEVSADGTLSVSPTTDTTYVLTVSGTENRSVNCTVPITVTTVPVVNPAPVCDSFTATPATIAVGGTSQLAWQTSNATRVVINNAIGEVSVDGSVSISPVSNTTYVLTVFGTDNRSVNCQVPVVVSATPIPVCEFFTATPNSFSNGGGNVTLAWKLNNVSAASISPNIGSVATQGNQTVSVNSNTTFVLTGTNQTNNQQVTCTVPVTVSTPTPVLSCANNVNFTASDTSINEGENVTLNWSTTNLDSLTISVINATALSGSTTVDPRSDTTYVLTARKGTQSVDCPLSINVDEDNSRGGGGGGSSSPRCELTVSDNKIKSGDQITLRWNTSNATALEIEDDRGKTIATTDRLSASDKKDVLDGSIKLRPTRDTEYTLVAERGSKDRTCKVKVDVEDLTVLTNRDQQPLVAGISLSNVPYTGFEAGPILTLIFYVLLLAWALFITYVIILRRQSTPEVANINQVESHQGVSVVQPVQVVQSTFTQPQIVVPSNLPVGSVVIGYGNQAVESITFNPHHVNDEVVTAIENRAHEQMALLSSDAISHFIATTEGALERNEALDTVISEAKSTYPLEDGWIVINETRMRGLCEVCVVNQTTSKTESFTPVMVPEGSSSLAEAIITGNIVAAYEMIGNRPMFALADAAADFDAVYRARQGADVSVSNLLAKEAAELSDQKIKDVIAALTGALDGTYTDEPSAVKMAIMKAVKAIA